MCRAGSGLSPQRHGAGQGGLRGPRAELLLGVPFGLVIGRGRRGGNMAVLVLRVGVCDDFV